MGRGRPHLHLSLSSSHYLGIEFVLTVLTPRSGLAALPNVPHTTGHPVLGPPRDPVWHAATALPRIRSKDPEQEIDRISVSVFPADMQMARERDRTFNAF